MVIQQDIIPLGTIEQEETERNFLDDVSTSWDIVNLSFGDGVDVASRNSTFAKYPDYKENEQYYKAYEDTSSWYKPSSMEKMDREMLEIAVNENKFDLDADGNVVAGENTSPITLNLFDLDAVKGALLARRNGWGSDVANQAYIDETAKQSKELATKAQGSSTSAKVVGTLAGYLFRKETAMEIAASPAKIVGKTIMGGVGKAFVTEFGIAVFGETLREQQIREHMAKADLDYTLWDSVRNILIGAGLAGTIRGIGSGAVDYNTLRKIRNSDGYKNLAATDKEILGRYLRREQMKLTTNSRANVELLRKAETDLNNGKTVDVSEHTDIDIETLTDDAVEEVSMPKIMADENTEALRNVDELHKQIDEVKPIQQMDDDIYEGMATPQQADELFNEMAEIDPEIKVELDAINAERNAIKNPTIDESREASRQSKQPLNQRAQEVQDAAEYGIGEKLGEREARLESIFRKNTSDDARFKKMSQEDIDELERMDLEDLSAEADMVFAKGGDNLAAGMIAGIEQDEQGNITFDPAKFAAGLGGYSVVKALAKNPTVRGEIKGYLERTIDELEQKPGFDVVTGTQRAVPQDKPKGLLARKKAERLEAGLPESGGREIYYPERDKNYFYHPETDTVYFEARGKWREMPNEEIRKDIKYIDEHGVKAFKDMKAGKEAEFEAAMKEAEAREAKANETYKDMHTAPTRDQDNATSIDDLTKIYPEDVYSKNGARYYGHGDDVQDRISMNILHRIKDKPKAKVSIYRTIPEDIDADINVGDWVTINKQYAREHGENRFNGKYKLLEKRVKAEDIITDGNSIHEQGYDPKVSK